MSGNRRLYGCTHRPEDALADRAPFRRSVESLRAEAVKILLGPGGIQPHPPRTGDDLIASYPGHLGLDEAERMLDPRTPEPVKHPQSRRRPPPIASTKRYFQHQL